MGQAGYRVPFLIGLRLFGIMACSGASAAAAQAPERTLQLAWNVPQASGCATAEEMRLQVERLSERAPFVAEGEPADYTIAGTIEPFDTTWRARIALHDAHGRPLGEREVLGRSPTCRTLNVPVALVIVTLADSLSAPASGGVPAAAATPPRPSPKPALRGPVELGDPAGEPDAPEPPGQRLGLGAFAAVDLNLLPSATPGIGAALETRVPVPVAFEAALYALVDELDAQGRGGRFFLWHVGGGVCPELRVSRGALRAQLCAGGQIGAIDAAGRGLTEAYSAQRLVALLGFEPKLVWFWSRGLTLRASILAGWVLARPSFRVDIEGQMPRVLKSDPVALQLRLGVMGFAW